MILIGDVKSNVPAVPTVDPSSFTITPDPEPTTFVRPEPSPTNELAVNAPVTTAPVLVVSILFDPLKNNLVCEPGTTSRPTLLSPAFFTDSVDVNIFNCPVP